MKWLKIASLVTVGLVLAVFALMGLLYSTRGTPARAVISFDAGTPPAVGDSAFLSSIELLTHTRIEPGHTIELLANAAQTYPRLWSDLRSAQRSIVLHMYYGKPGQLADSLKHALVDRARAGVRVLLLLDAFGTQDFTDEYLDSLRAAGVRVAAFRPIRFYTLYKAQNRSHGRVVVIDDRVAYTGGFGIADQWLTWRETNVRFTGPAVAQMHAAFAIAWAEATGELLTGRAYIRQNAHYGNDARAGLLYVGPTISSSPAERYLALSIAGARQRIYIANSYFVPDDDQRRLLIAAARRGVDVRVLTAGKKTDVRIVRHASHARYEELLRGGVRIFEYQPAMLHSKTMVVDGIWSTVGTMNFDNRSLSFNDETNLLIHDAAVGMDLERQYLADLRHSNEFKLEFFEKRSLKARILDGAASQIAKLL